MLIKNCRSCSGNKFKKLFSLGNLSFTGKFAKNSTVNIPKAELALVMCDDCDLVQLNNNFNLKYLYGPDYGYRTGINKTMTEHMRSVVSSVKKIANLKRKDAVLDIASNDGTLLNFYSKSLFRAGIDPTIKKFSHYYKKIDSKIPDFFSEKAVRKETKKTFKVITALSVFYDIENPNYFLSDVNKLLDDDGIFVLEQADLLSIIKLKMFDTICHEHLEYYSHKVIIKLLKKNNLKLFDFKFNDINGGSTQYYICKDKNIKVKVQKNKIMKMLNNEKKFKLDEVKTYKNFFIEIQSVKKKLNKIIKKIKFENKIIHGYGASTKGNVLLQYFNINKNHIDCISDRNPKKNGFYTPNTKIKIVSELYSRKINPDYYLVLPWHFKKEILQREKKQNKFSKFIFPLPSLEIY
jgi:hypothetical protein